MDWRLKRKKEIQSLLKTKVKIHAKTMNFFCLKQKTGGTRFVIIVSKKVSPLAIERNRARRQVRAMIREALPKQSPSIDIAVVVKKEFLTEEFAKNKLIFQKLLHKVLLGEN